MIYKHTQNIEKYKYTFTGDTKAEVIYDYSKGIINIKYFNKYIECYEVEIVVYPFIIFNAGLYDMVYSNIPKVNIKRNRIINNL